MRIGFGVVGLMLLASGSGWSQTSELTSLQWLAGCWEGRRGPVVTLEMWMPPAGNLMLGASRTVSDGKVRSTERLSLAVEDDRLVYTAFPSDQAEARFTSVEVTDSGFVVENPTHDFPRRISYRRAGDSLLAWIEGPGSQGPRRIPFGMRRIGCDGS